MQGIYRVKGTGQLISHTGKKKLRNHAGRDVEYVGPFQKDAAQLAAEKEAAEKAKQPAPEPEPEPQPVE